LSAIENLIDLQAEPRHPVRIDGGGNQLSVGKGTEVESRMDIRGDHNRLLIGARCHITGFMPAGGGSALIDPRPDVMATLTVEGSGNIIEIADDCRLGANLTVIGDNNRVRIESGCAINGFVSLLCPTGSTLVVGAGTTMVQVSIQLHEPGEIRFGADCMVSSQTYVSLSDIHPIYDRTSGERINPAASVIVGRVAFCAMTSSISASQAGTPTVARSNRSRAVTLAAARSGA
jgi:carbonic anhydrase/acetyltransferase-like protein (isoleucine patch superfamily)